MPELKNKTILLISPQSWGKMFISKHHYAIELAKQGNTVFFLNPPEERSSKVNKKIMIEPYKQQENLFIIRHKLSFPYDIKFHFISLFHALMKVHVKKILRNINRPIDLIWSFDLGHLYPFSLFPASSFKLFHPVDEPLTTTAINSAGGAQAICSVTVEILEKYKQFNVPEQLVNHGVAEYFLAPAPLQSLQNGQVHVGFSGNLLRDDIDRTTTLKIFRENPQIIFECWGSFQLSHSNIGGAESQQLKEFIYALKELPNVELHGVVDSKTLAKELRRMDAFLICYDIKKDQSGGTNYHKIMEFLGNGKVIISNNVTAYRDHPELVRMGRRRDNNDEIPALFKETISQLHHHNSEEFQQRRIDFARQNTYSAQIERIGDFIKRI